ncbi:MoaD/ThiS family protein [Belliella kenyensis]|uniref:MoaD/ThiS family protein n=1 Tax=Belliella kenyensis TaxID=1472724 RepID=A0ABV8EI93_9BACT|nr:MoaD/ThiS family protein [Belliella kenyensis]MCH7401062.1 MoaD/ThiS family protein [Belliella kenyensis]MDN3604060.1 MoaD/ThiS family protein [Belliella kenyensis]
MKILAFGKIAEIVGNEVLIVDNFPNTEILRGYLYHQYPALEHMKFTIAVDKKLTSGESHIPMDVEVALLPPFSGG